MALKLVKLEIRNIETYGFDDTDIYKKGLPRKLKHPCKLNNLKQQSKLRLIKHGS